MNWLVHLVVEEESIKLVEEKIELSIKGSGLYF